MYSPFTADVLAAFEAAYRDHKPADPDEQAFNEAPQPRSAALSFSNVGVCVRFALPDGSTTDLSLNPYLARALALIIFQHGDRAGWLDDEGNFRVSPTYRA